MNFLLYENFYDMVFTRHSAGKIWSSICIQDVVLHYQRIIPIQLIWLVFCIRFAWKVNLMKMIIYMFRTQRRINPIQDGLFRGCSRMMGGLFGPPLLKICHTYSTMMKLGRVIPYRKKVKKYMNHVTHLLSFADISIFHRKSANSAVSRNTDIDCFLIHNFHLFQFFLSLYRLL